MEANGTTLGMTHASWSERLVRVVHLEHPQGPLVTGNDICVTGSIIEVEFWWDVVGTILLGTNVMQGFKFISLASSGLDR